MRTGLSLICLISLMLVGCGNNGGNNSGGAGSSSDSLLHDTLSDSLPVDTMAMVPPPVMTADSLACLTLKMSTRKIPAEYPGFYDSVMRDVSDYGPTYTLRRGDLDVAILFADDDDRQIWKIMVLDPAIKAQLPNGKVVCIGQSLNALTQQMGNLKIGFNEEVGAFADAGRFEISITPDFLDSGNRKLDEYDGEKEIRLLPTDFTPKAQVDCISIL